MLKPTKFAEHIKESLIKERSFSIYLIGRLELVPARKGKVNGTFGGHDKPNAKFRVRFKPSKELKKWLKTI